MTEVSDLQTLSARTVNVLMRNGIHSVDEIKANYPKGLLRLTGFGMRALREVEAVFFPGFRYDQKSAKSKRLPNGELAAYLRSKASKPPQSNHAPRSRRFWTQAADCTQSESSSVLVR